ncbi:MAG: sugar phosphate isomerase/epimerase family protein [Verrucomicrobiota bacterium]
MRIGINTFLLTPGFSNNDIPILKTIKDYGADFVELAIVESEGFKTSEVRDALDATGLDNPIVCGAWGPGRDLRGSPQEVSNSRDYLESLIKIAQDLGSDLICGPFYSSGGRTEPYPEAVREEQLDLISQSLRPLCEKAGDQGITLAFEPLNRFETDCINTVDQAIDLIDRVDHNALKIHIDTFHMHIEENNSAEAIRRAGGHIGHVHASASHRGILGKDQIQWDQIIQALVDIGYDRSVCIEAFSPEMASLAKAASIWRKLYDSPQALATEGIQFLKTKISKAKETLHENARLSV